MNRRLFISILLFRPRLLPTAVQVAVIESFDLDGKTAAMLVHHDDPGARESFAAWLRNRTGSAVRIRTKAGAEMTASIFRVRMCFGRALIIPDGAVHIREREVLDIFD